MVGRVRALQASATFSALRWPPTTLLLILSTVIATAFTLAAGSLLTYGLTHGPTIYYGVQVAGIDVGGMTPEEAKGRLSEHYASFSSGNLALQAEERTFELPLRDLGLTADLDASVTRAYRYGRTGNLWQDSADWFRALVFGRNIPVQVKLDEQAVLAAFQTIAPEVARAPRDARFVVKGGGEVSIEPEQPGIGIDVPASYRALQRQVATLSLQPVSLKLVEIEPQVTADDLKPLLPRAREVFGQPFYLVHGDVRWEISPEVLLRFVHLRASEGDEFSVDADRPALEAYIASVAERAFVAPKDASVRWEAGRFVVDPPVAGEELDPAATVEAMLSALESGQHEVELRAKPVPAAVTAEMAEEAAREAQRLVAGPLTLRWEDGSVEIPPERLAELLTFVPEEQQGQVTGLAVEIDRERLVQALEELRGKVEVPARDAELRYYDGRVQVVEAEQVGHELDVAASVEAVRAAILDGTREAELVTRTVQPQITSTMASQIVIRELISSGQTYYGGSVPNRKHNVELATQRANGALVPPGGTFSFTETVGAINLDTGYKVGYGIVATNGRVSTVPSVGGGVCQVSTTLFHAAFWGGFPIVERNWHLYWIPLYGQPPSGITGLDATVDTDYGLDFKFKNTTNDWIAIVAKADGQWVRFEIWGTKPGWRVEVDDPIVTNVVKADPTPVFRESTDLSPGQQVVIEQARDGFDVEIRRRVYQGDQLIDELVLRSHYLPSSNVTLVGPRPGSSEQDSPSEQQAPVQPTPEPVPQPGQ